MTITNKQIKRLSTNWIVKSKKIEIMKTAPHKTERLHALDSLRAIMMMLGIVLHSGVTYLGGEASNGWPLRDPSASSSFIYWLIAIIHNFRMPIFMVVAGFFAALLLANF